MTHKANSIGSDQTLQNAASDQGLSVCHSSSNILDISAGGKIDLFKF